MVLVVAEKRVECGAVVAVSVTVWLTDAKQSAAAKKLLSSDLGGVLPQWKMRLIECCIDFTTFPYIVPFGEAFIGRESCIMYEESTSPKSSLVSLDSDSPANTP